MAVISQNEIHVKYVLDSTQLQNATQAMSGLTAQERQLLNDLKKLQAQLNATGQTGAGAGRNIASSFGSVGAAVQALIPVFSVAFAVDKIQQFARYAFNVSMQFEQMGKTLSFVTGSTEKANQQFSYMTALAQSMGLNVRALVDGYKGFAAAASFAGVSQDQINNEMKAFTKAAAALSMSADDTKLMFNALAQMYSKNVVQAEELRGQLGERLPGAMQLLAKAMKVPVESLDDLARKGLIVTKEVMPAFANEVTLAFGTAADKTDTLTAAYNRFFTALETMVVRVMSGSIGDSIKWLFGKLEGMADFIKYLASDTLEWEQDFQSKRKVNVEKNVLYEIEALRKAAKEREGIELSASEAAQRIVNDQKTGWAGFYKYRAEKLKEASANERKTNRENLLGFIDDTKQFAVKATTAFVDGLKAIANMITSPIKLAKAAWADFSGDTKNGLATMYSDLYKSAQAARNLEVQSEIDHYETRLKTAESFITKQAALKQKEVNDAEEKAGKDAKNRYSKELAALELQERIARLNAEATIENEHKRSQEAIRIGVEFNKKKADVDQKYNQQSLANESQSMKDLRELTQNNYNLRIAENNSFRSQIRRNDDKYYKEGYDAAVKELKRMEDWRKTQADKTADIEEKERRRKLQIGKSKLEAQLINDRLDGEIQIQNSADIFDKKIAEAEAQKAIELKNDKLLGDKKKEIQNKWNDEILKLINEKMRAKAALMLYWGNKEVENQAAIDRKLFQERAKAIKEYVDRDNYRLQTNQLREKNALRDKKGNYRQEEELDIKHQFELVDNKIKGNQAIINNNVEFLNTQKDLTKEERDAIISENNTLTDEIERAYEERNRIALDSRDKRIAYETEVFKQSVVLMQTLVNGMFDLQQEAYQRQIDALNNQAEEQIRLADGNQQKIDAINQERRMKEREIKRKQFKAEQAAAVAQVIFNTAPIIAQYLAKPPTIPLGVLAGMIAAAQIGFILAKPIPEYEKGTKGKRHKGGPAIVGEAGVEKVVTESGKVYYTPPTATLLDLPRGAQVIPNDQLSKQDIYYASSMSGRGNKLQESGNIERKLDEIGKILNGLPIHQISMDERGFEKYIRTEKRTTKILNNRFGKTN